jgi:hypothetical protein
MGGWVVVLTTWDPWLLVFASELQMMTETVLT